MVKAELELMQGEKEESGFDLDKVRHLLELCIGKGHVHNQYYQFWCGFNYCKFSFLNLNRMFGFFPFRFFQSEAEVREENKT